MYFSCIVLKIQCIFRLRQIPEKYMYFSCISHVCIKTKQKYSKKSMYYSCILMYFSWNFGPIDKTIRYCEIFYSFRLVGFKVFRFVQCSAYILTSLKIKLLRYRKNSYAVFSRVNDPSL